MGSTNSKSNDKTNDKLDLQGEQYKPNQMKELNEKLKIIQDAINYNVKLHVDCNMDRNIKRKFTKKYGLYFDFERFVIPIIGVINSGKSTFMNNFLNLNKILQIGDTVTTNFITNPNY